VINIKTNPRGDERFSHKTLESRTVSCLCATALLSAGRPQHGWRKFAAADIPPAQSNQVAEALMKSKN